MATNLKSWNFKNNFCTDAGNVCNHAEEHGAGAVHGITSAFFGDVNPTFRALYEGKLILISNLRVSPSILKIADKLFLVFSLVT